MKNGCAKNGGAIYINYWGELSITNLLFTENRARYNGGAIQNHGKLTIARFILNNNTTKDGGAIYNIWKRKLTITESTLTGNTAQKESGGAIHNHGEKSFNITNCKIRK